MQDLEAPDLDDDRPGKGDADRLNQQRPPRSERCERTDLQQHERRHRDPQRVLEGEAEVRHERAKMIVVAQPRAPFRVPPRDSVERVDRHHRRPHDQQADREDQIGADDGRHERHDTSRRAECLDGKREEEQPGRIGRGMLEPGKEHGQTAVVVGKLIPAVDGRFRVAQRPAGCACREDEQKADDG